MRTGLVTVETRAHHHVHSRAARAGPVKEEARAGSALAAAFAGRRAAAARRIRDIDTGDRVFRALVAVFGGLIIAVLAGIMIVLARASLPAFGRFGWRFLTDRVWDPVR